MIKKVSSKIVYKNKWMSVREDKVVFPNGEKGIYSVVDKASFALIIPMFENGFQLVNQYRYSVSARYWEFPQGAYEEQPNIDPLVLAQEELREETGLTANILQKIGFFYEAYGYSTQGFHIFLATDLNAGEAKREESEQGMVTKKVSFTQFEQMVLDGSIVDAP